MPAQPSAVADSWESIDSVSSLVLDVLTGLRWGNGLPGLIGTVCARIQTDVGVTVSENGENGNQSRSQRRWLECGNGKPASGGRPAPLV
jgi:hypothetical protein